MRIRDFFLNIFCRFKYLLFLCGMKTQNLYPIGIYFLCDDLSYDDYEEGNENTYYLNQEQYEQFCSMSWTDYYEMIDWFKTILSEDCIYEMPEYINRRTDCEPIDGYDYKKQEFLILSEQN